MFHSPEQDIHVLSSLNLPRNLSPVAALQEGIECLWYTIMRRCEGAFDSHKSRNDYRHNMV